MCVCVCVCARARVCGCFCFVSVFSLTIEVVTFRLHGWCMLGVFLLPALTRLGHECQDLLVHALECMCAQTRPGLKLPSNRVVGGMESEPMLTPKGKIPTTRSSEEDGNYDAASSRTASPTHYRLSYAGPSPRGCL